MEIPLKPLSRFRGPLLRGGTMVLRWVAAGVLEAAKGFRRVKGCKDMPALVAALQARDARLGLGESSEMVA